MTKADPALLSKICDRAFAHMNAMVHFANNRKNKQPGDPKVGGHPASCASSLHILGALHLAVREVDDYIAVKPHGSPMDHSFHHLMRLFRDQNKSAWFSDEEAEAAMHTLRQFPEGTESVFQSYHARTDPDSFHMLPTGSVGIPPVVSVYMALAHRYAGDHKLEVPPHAHFWSLIGDSEFREGSLLECMPDAAERELGNVTWIVDYNRQNLDGTRIPNERGLTSRDCERIEATSVANGWRCIQVRHGRFREGLFAKQGGDALQRLFEDGLSDYEYQALLLTRNAVNMRKHCIQLEPDCKAIVESLSDEEVVRLFTDVGGHDMEVMIEALRASKEDPNHPFMVVAHTIKGWGLESFANPANHSTLPRKAEIEAILGKHDLNLDRAFQLFDESSPEGQYLAERSQVFRAGIERELSLRQKNRDTARENMQAAGGLPDSLGIDTSLFPRVNTQWAWGQLSSKLVRIGLSDVEDFNMAGSKTKKELSAEEQRWKSVADYVLTMSPDVGTSTNIAPGMDNRIYGPEGEVEIDDIEIDTKHPDLQRSQSAFTGHIRFEIAEANCMSAVAAFGKMGHYTGIPFFPIMTVYDFFIKRALDQLYYNLYWGAEFVILGTPSGITLSSEGAQHSWKSDIQIPNLITWEPVYAIEMDWILSDALKRHMEDRNDGRRGVLIRAVTRSISQKMLPELLSKQARFKSGLPEGALLKPAGAGEEWGEAIDESTIASIDETSMLESVRELCLAGGYFLVDWSRYAGYEPGDNVVHIFCMGSLVTEAVEASDSLLKLGIFANVIVMSSPDLLIGGLADANGYSHLRQTLGINGDLHVVNSELAGEAELISLAGRRIPIVAACDGEAGLMDNIGSIVGVKQTTMAVRKFSKCGRPDQIFKYQNLDSASIVEACGKALSETALENLNVSSSLLERMAGRGGAPIQDWRELWPNAGEQN